MRIIIFRIESIRTGSFLRLNVSMSLRAIIESAVPAESAEVLEFLRIAGDEKLLPRPAGDYRRAIERGLFYAARADRRLIAVAAVFMMSERTPAILEMGSCYVAPEFRGFGCKSFWFALALPPPSP